MKRIAASERFSMTALQPPIGALAALAAKEPRRWGKNKNVAHHSGKIYFQEISTNFLLQIQNDQKKSSQGVVNQHDAGAPTGMLHPHFLGTL